MRALILAPVALALGACQCQPTAVRHAVSRVTHAETSGQFTTTTTQTFSYADARLFGARELSNGSLTVTTNPGGTDDYADYSFEYDEDGVLQRWVTTSTNDNLDRTVYFRYTDQDRIKMIETDAGPSNVSEINIEANYLDDGHYDNLIWEWGWWIFQSNERAVVSYDDHGRVQDLDGASTDVHYAWGDNGLEQVDVVVENQDDLHYALGYDDQDRLTSIDEGDSHWTLEYDKSSRLDQITVTNNGVQETVAYEYADGDSQGVRIAPRVPLFVNFVFDTSGRALYDLDILALPDYF